MHPIPVSDLPSESTPMPVPKRRRLPPIRTALATALLLFPLSSQPGDLNTEMQSFFDEMGTLGNVSEPGAFRGQAMNLYTGGSLMMRAPGRNFPLVSARLPSLKAGCGGIDLFGGAFSFINRQQFVALLQNIGANAVGYAFKLALQSISPDIDKLLTELQDQINKINALNINSCEAAQALVNGAVGEYDNSVMSGCANISQYLGSVSDRAEGRTTCASNAPSVMRAAADSTDENVRERVFVKGNVVWQALKRVGTTVSREERELVLSILGTVILTPPADDGTGASTRTLEPTVAGLRDLLLGSQAADAADRVKVTLYVCDETEQCLEPTRTATTVKPFSRLVAERLQRLSDGIANRTVPTEADIGFVNATTEPVYRMLSIANTIPGSGMAPTLIETYKDVIALDYAETFLTRVLRQALSALAQSPDRNRLERDALEALRRNADTLRQQIAAEKQAAYARLRSVSALTQDLQNLERQLWGTMPPALKSMLDFSRTAGHG